MTPVASPAVRFPLASLARRAGLALVAFALAASFMPSRAAGDPTTADPFAGEWSVAATPDGDAAADGQGPFTEAVLFHDGQFSAAVFAMMGFTPARYAVDDDDAGRPVFVALLASEDRGTLAWSGRETPTGIGGTLVWTRADGSETRYTIAGEKQ